MARVGVDFVNSRSGSPAACPSVFHSTLMIRRALEPLSPPICVTSMARAPGYVAPTTPVIHCGVTASPCHGTSSANEAAGCITLSQTDDTAERDREDNAAVSNSIDSCNVFYPFRPHRFLGQITGFLAPEPNLTGNDSGGFGHWLYFLPGTVLAPSAPYRSARGIPIGTAHQSLAE